MKAVVMPLLGAPVTNQAFHYLVGNTSALPDILYVVLIGAAFGEETLFRGYAFERLGALLGRSVWANAFIVSITSAWFGWEHHALQGLPGVQQAALVGIVFGAIVAITAALDSHLRSRCIRPDCRRDHLLGSRSRRSSPLFWMNEEATRVVTLYRNG